jgi:hypothetical protein
MFAAEFDLIVIGRCSGEWIVGGYDEMMTGNLIIANKYEMDFLHPASIRNQESVAWHHTAAWEPFPYIHPNRSVVPLQAEDDTNKFCNARFIEFFENTTEDVPIQMLMRGIDGGRIDYGTWLLLGAMYPTRDITLVFSLERTIIEALPFGEVLMDLVRYTVPFL